MICPNCTPSTYIVDCVDCGVRLIASARSAGDPKTARKRQEAFLASIERRAGRGVRDAVVAKMRGAQCQ